MELLGLGDAVGTSVLLDVRFDATIFGRGGPKPSVAVVEKALAATKAKVNSLMHHESVFAWYRSAHLRRT